MSFLVGNTLGNNYMTKLEKALTKHVKEVHPRLCVKQRGDRCYAVLDECTIPHPHRLFKSPLSWNSTMALKLNMASPNWIKLLEEDFKPFNLYFDRLHKVLNLFNGKIKTGAVIVWAHNRPDSKFGSGIGFSIQTDIFRTDTSDIGGTWRYSLCHECIKPEAKYQLVCADFEDWYAIFLNVLTRHNALKGEL